MSTTDVTQQQNQFQTLNIRKEVEINAPVAITFESILEEIGPGSVLEDGTPFHMKLEPFPGGDLPGADLVGFAIPGDDRLGPRAPRRSAHGQDVAQRLLPAAGVQKSPHAFAPRQHLARQPHQLVHLQSR